MCKHVFTYGSLMLTPIWSQLVQGQYEQVIATLNGYQRVAMRKESYPAALPKPFASIQGILYRDVKAADIAKLDYFEGDYYLRCSEIVTTIKGKKIPAEVYVLNKQYRHLASATQWDINRFRLWGIRQCLQWCQGFD